MLIDPKLRHKVNVRLCRGRGCGLSIAEITALTTDPLPLMSEWRRRKWLTGTLGYAFFQHVSRLARLRQHGLL